MVDNVSKGGVGAGVRHRQLLFHTRKYAHRAATGLMHAYTTSASMCKSVHRTSHNYKLGPYIPALLTRRVGGSHFTTGHHHTNPR